MPYKLVLSERRPVTLEVRLRNEGREEKLVSVTLVCGKELSLNPGGFVRRQEKRLGKLKPGERIIVRFQIYAKPTTLPGVYPLDLYVTEHFESYDYVQGERRIPLTLRVV